jgi:hypothetical protein
MMGHQLEECALDLSRALLRSDYSAYDGEDYRPAERIKTGADETAIDNLLRLKEQRFISLVREEADAEQLRQIALKNAGDLEYEKVLIPLLERYAEICGPNLLLSLLLSSLYWTQGNDEAANRYLDMAAELDSDNVYVLRHRLLYTNDAEALASTCRQILDRYPGDPVATETLIRIDKGLTPYASARSGEHASVDRVLENLTCNTA